MTLIDGISLVTGAKQAAVRNVVLTERSDLSRELHDILAHTLSGLVVDLEASRLLAAHESVSGQLQQRLDGATNLARAGLVEAKGALTALREGEPPGPDQLPELISAFDQRMPYPCRLTVSGTARPLAPAARIALYRTTQEALTNVSRHASPAAVDVSLAWQPDAVTLTVVDRGGRAPIALGRGHGLTGMRERAELAGGELHSGPTPEGFRVELELPV